MFRFSNLCSGSSHIDECAGTMQFLIKTFINTLSNTFANTYCALHCDAIYRKQVIMKWLLISECSIFLPLKNHFYGFQYNNLLLMELKLKI